MANQSTPADRLQRELRILAGVLELLSDLVRDSDADADEVLDALQQAVLSARSRLMVASWADSH